MWESNSSARVYAQQLCKRLRSEIEDDEEQKIACTEELVKQEAKLETKQEIK